MSYYILPKKIINFDFYPVIDGSSSSDTKPFISFSLYNYLNANKEQLNAIENSDIFFYLTNENALSFLTKIINPYEFIFTKVPNSKFSVSKLKPYSNLFYVLMEIFGVFNLLDSFSEKNKNIVTMSYGSNSCAVIECLNMLREDCKDANFHATIDISQMRKLDFFRPENFRLQLYDFLYYELDEDEYNEPRNYILSMLFILCNLFYYQDSNGVAVIKIADIYYKPLVETLYILSGIYEKVYIIKPSVSNAIKSERYIVCKNFICNSQLSKMYYMYFVNIDAVTKSLNPDDTIVSILKEPPPYYFLNKIEESNITIGYQQLEYVDQLLSLFKNKNKEDKMETLKKNNIQKCIQWCEKFKIPYNKFTEKVNIFLNGEKSGEDKDGVNLFLTQKSVETNSETYESDVGSDEFNLTCNQSSL
jgi:hypothetical protein